MTNSVRSLDASAVEKFCFPDQGKITLPGDPAYDDTRKVYNAMIDKHPGMIVKCVDVADVIHSVNFGRENGLLVSVRGVDIMPAVSVYAMTAWLSICRGSNLYW